MVTFCPKLIAFVVVSALLCIGVQTARAADQSGQWDLALTGGFVATGLVDPVYALGNVSGQPTRVVVRETDQESTANLGIAMFAQVYHDRLSWLAPLSFGIGLRGDSRATFYLGPALRFGSHASFTGGIAIGPVALPAGRRVPGDGHQLPSTRHADDEVVVHRHTFASLQRNRGR